MMKKCLFLLILTLCLLSVAQAAGPEVTFSLESGFYEYPMPLEMKCSIPQAVIHYTLDGSTPDQDSPVYSGTLTLMNSNDREDVLTKITGVCPAENYTPQQDYPTGHVVRAVAIAPDGSRSAEACGTYLIGYDRKALYGEIPVVFLVTDPEGLFDYDTGIYVMGRHYDEWIAQQTESYESWQIQGNFSQRGNAWERPVMVTYLPWQEKGFTQLMGMRIKGGASRGNNQKSLRLIARKEYGKKNVEYPLYPDNVRESDGGVVEKYKSFTLRTGGNDTDFGRIRDPYIQNLATGMRFETAQNRPVLAFLNGEFWGVYTLNEEYTDKYIQYHYGIDDNNVITVKCGAIDDGKEKDIDLFTEMFEYIAFGDMSDAGKYEKACQMLDMGSFADYCALNFYIANEDGPFQNNNWQMWRVRQPQIDVHPYADGRWRMMVYDTDFSSGIYKDGSNFSADFITPVLTGTDYKWRHPALLFNSLIQSETFQTEFIRSCCDVRNIYFTKARTAAMLREMTDQYMPYVPDTLRRFGPQWVTWNAERHFKGQLDFIAQFFQMRPDHFINSVKSALELNSAFSITVKVKGDGEVFLNGRNIPTPHNSRIKVFSECGLTATAVPAPGATFTGWTVSHESVQLSDPGAETTQIAFSRVFTLTANFE